MEIRVLEQADARAWWDLRLESLHAEPFAFGKAVEEHLVTPVEIVTAPDRFTLGAFDGARLIGMATFKREVGVKDFHKGGVYGVYVTGAYRGRGIAKQLFLELLDRARRCEGLEQVLLVVGTDNPAKKLYQSLGFKTFGLEPRALKVGATYVDEEHMLLMFGNSCDT